jgi:hypothetical protein
MFVYTGSGFSYPGTSCKKSTGSRIRKTAYKYWFHVKKELDPGSATLRVTIGQGVKKALYPGSAALRISPGSRVKKALDPGSATLLISTVPPGPGVKNALDPGSATLLISTGPEGRKAQVSWIRNTA